MAFYGEHLASAAFFGAIALGSLWYGKKQGFFSLPKESKPLPMTLNILCSSFGVYLVSMLVLPFGLMKLRLVPAFVVQPLVMLLCFFFSFYSREFCLKGALKGFLQPLPTQ